MNLFHSSSLCFYCCNGLTSNVFPIESLYVLYVSTSEASTYRLTKLLVNKDEKINILYPDSKQLFSKEWYDKLYGFRNLNVLQKDNFYAIIDIPEHKFVSDWMERQFFTGFFFVFKTKQNNLAVYKYGDNKPFAIVDDVVKIDFITIAVRKGMNYYSLSLPNSNDEISVNKVTREDFDSWK